ncbi:XRE family transcriptional regulator [Xenorhabdus bovienii]|uniref:Peptidase S24-like protein n=1 Tax=Xenorhabdus bovienii str. Intermedium TaxID=1379677 RepID=A0A077QL58_XENBV|nr:S24 family peptidase [Xenorhabdus bovienii]MDE9484185.1 helix-turn-helix domain-containing protein [Xenorhabdus bovienii]CDH34035.1 Peptidase S24-like protein [Xenorhabdus bovienii str. Intermedium]
MSDFNVGIRIRELRKSRNMTLLELAHAIGGDVGNLSRLERGKQGFSESSLAKIAEALSVPVSELFSHDSFEGIKKDSDERPITKVQNNRVFRIEMLDVAASISPRGGFSDITPIIHSIEYDPEYAKSIFGNRTPSSVSLVNVRGDSMSDTIEPGDLVFIDTSIKHFDGDGIYSFDFNGDFFIKRLQKVKLELKVISDNKAYETWSLSPEEAEMIQIHGKILISQTQTMRRYA